MVLCDSGDIAAGAQQDFLGSTTVSAAGAKDRQDDTLLHRGTLYAHHAYMSRSRHLGSGGTSKLWCVKWRPGAESRVRIVKSAVEDFAARADFDMPAWQVPGEDVYRQYDAAMAFFDLGEHSFDLARYDGLKNPLGLSQDVLPSKVFHFARATSVFENRMADAHAHDGIQVVSGLHLMRIETTRQDSVTELVFTDSARQEHRIKAKHYVLALGGIETARQLLLAAEDGTLRDPHDVWGRWFCDHPHTRLGYLSDADPEALADRANWYDFQDCHGTPIMRGHEIAPQVAREEGLLRFSIDLIGRPPEDDTVAGVALAEAWDLVKGKRYLDAAAMVPKLAIRAGTAWRLAQTMRRSRVHNTGHGGWSDPAVRYHPNGSLAVEAMFEQRPSPDNRIRLGDRRDPFGRRMPVLQWSWSEVETRAINRAADFVAAAFETAGAGQFKTMRDLGRGDVPRAGSGFHHMGGMRQSAEPAEGAVDGDNRLHGVENLTLLGSSIFPNTAGYANPTLTAVADALRVADRFSKTSISQHQTPPYVADLQHKEAFGA